ncbi:hypothetical protein MHU86_19379 [Fragilaria crotonensis]|nr:hypothetical protein MHU86_19379 [Fragilaria crotonensis]
MKGLIPKEKKLYLPYTQRTVSLIFFDASEVFASLLSCPTLNQDGNYFFDKAKDPFVAPETSSHVGDIHTGRCYRKTYDALIKKPDVDMLLPVSWQWTRHTSTWQADSDGANNNLSWSSEPLNTSAPNCHANPRIHQSQHPAHLPSDSEIDAEFNAPLTCQRGPPVLKTRFGAPKTYNGKIHPVVFHPYVPFIIGDTEGHDRLCGHYTARFSQIQQLCRICECPTYLSGYSKSNFRHRVPKKIDALVSKGHTVELQLLSQNYLKNGFAEVRFGLHNQRGIFGACPGEMLHLISLGWFKYCLQAFSAQAGPNSNALKQYDVLR